MKSLMKYLMRKVYPVTVAPAPTAMDVELSAALVKFDSTFDEQYFKNHFDNAIREEAAEASVQPWQKKNEATCPPPWHKKERRADPNCVVCKSAMLARNGRFGEFYFCKAGCKKQGTVDSKRWHADLI